MLVVGLKAISDLAGLSEATILALVRDHGFPARQIRDGGKWVSTEEAIEAWAYHFCMTPMRPTDYGSPLKLQTRRQTRERWQRVIA